MTEMKSGLWVSGYAVDPARQPLALAAQEVAEERSMHLEIPTLNVVHGKTVVVPSFEEQAENLVAHLEDEPDEIVTHSQGLIALAHALDSGRPPEGQHLTIVAPPLTLPAERLSKFFHPAGPTDEEKSLAEDYRGAHAVVRDRQRDMNVVLTKDYWEEVTEGVEAQQLLQDLIRHFDAKNVRVIRAGRDDRLGPQNEEYVRLVTATDISVETVPDATHEFNGCERAIAHAALFGEQFDVARQANVQTVTVVS
jgi:hypothetical protein